MILHGATDVDLAFDGRAAVLVTGDRALLEMDFGIEIEKAPTVLQ